MNLCGKPVSIAEPHFTLMRISTGKPGVLIVGSGVLLKLLQAKFRIQELEAELAERMRTLLSLVHSDKHGGSQVATDITVWLLEHQRKSRDPGRHGGF